MPSYAWAGLGALPLLIWWLGWYPGFASSDSIDQWGQVLRGPISNHHPAVHTLYLEVLSLGGRNPGLVTLVQLILFGVLLVYGARVLVRAGVPAWVAVGAAWLMGLSPALAPTTLSLWKDVPFALAFLWAWIELLGLALDPPPPASPGTPPTSGGRSEEQHPAPPASPQTPLPPAFGRGTPPASGGRMEGTGGRRVTWGQALRLGVALAAVWLFRGNGPLTVLPLLVLLLWLGRRQWRKPLATVATLAALAVLITGPIYALFEVRPFYTAPAQVYLADIASSYVREPETFTASDIEMLQDLAPLEVWTGRYECDESTPLVFDPAFNVQPVREEPTKWLQLELTVLLRDPDSVLEHRGCVSSYLYLPWTPEETYLHTPPYAIPDNDVGLVREPISDLAFAVTDWYWKWAEDYPWLTWRPAIVIWPALAAIVAFAFRARRLLLPSTLFLAHLANVTLTSPAQEFRYAYPLYLVAVLTITLSWPALGPVGKHIAHPEGTSQTTPGR